MTQQPKLDIVSVGKRATSDRLSFIDIAPADQLRVANLFLDDEVSIDSIPATIRGMSFYIERFMNRYLCDRLLVRFYDSAT